MFNYGSHKKYFYQILYKSNLFVLSKGINKSAKLYAYEHLTIQIHMDFHYY